MKTYVNFDANATTSAHIQLKTNINLISPYDTHTVITKCTVCCESYFTVSIIIPALKTNNYGSDCEKL